MDKLNILVLHTLGNPTEVPIFLRHHVFALKNNFPDHNYLYHDTSLPLPEYVRECAFDAIVLDVTLLWARWGPADAFAKLKSDYAFVRSSRAVKIAFPQDEYDCNELLDEWMCEWAVDVVYSVISSNWDVLYPKYHQSGTIKLGYTGYIDESLIVFPRRPFDERSIDIGYRASKLVPYFGRIGETKWTIGRDVAFAAKEYGLKTDIVLGEAGILRGTAWLDFINDSKFTLGANSGSSLIDRRGELRKCVTSYLADHPSASFEAVETHCFKGLDQKYSLTAISPRVLEAALLDSCQILVEGSYSGIIQPWEHYIPIKDDASDFASVADAIKDRSLVVRLIKNCRETILDCEEFRYKNKARKVLELIGSLLAPGCVESNAMRVESVAQRYKQEMAQKYEGHWRRIALRRKLIKFVDRYPAVSRILRSAKTYGKSSHVK